MKCTTTCRQQRTSESRLSLSSVQPILRGATPGCALPSNREPKGTIGTPLICASLRIYLSAKALLLSPTAPSSDISLEGRFIAIAVIKATARICDTAEKYIFQVITWADHMGMCGYYFPFTASESRYDWLRTDIVRIPFPVNGTSQRGRTPHTQWTTFPLQPDHVPTSMRCEEHVLVPNTFSN